MKPQQPVNDIVATRAKRWLVKQQAGFDQQQQADFDLWLDKHPDNRRELERLTALWHELDMLADGFNNTHTEQTDRSSNQRKRYWQPVATVACLLLIFSFTFLRVETQPVATFQSTGYYSSLKGQQQSIQLSDGSIVQLGPDSVAQVHFNQHKREVKLITGEAFFEVAKDPERPFIVSTALGNARAVGTAFNVHLYSGQLDLTVHEGIVDIVSGQSLAITRLVVGQQVRVRSGGRVETYSDIDLVYSAAWRHGTLVFSGQSLYQVVDDLNRYSQVPIVIADDRLLEVQVSGIFQSHNVDAVLTAIEASLPARISRSKQRISVYYNET